MIGGPLVSLIELPQRCFTCGTAVCAMRLAVSQYLSILVFLWALRACMSVQAITSLLQPKSVKRPILVACVYPAI